MIGLVARWGHNTLLIALALMTCALFFVLIKEVIISQGPRGAARAPFRSRGGGGRNGLDVCRSQALGLPQQPAVVADVIAHQHK